MGLPVKLLSSVIAAALVAGAISGCASLDRWQREAIFQTRNAVYVEGRSAPAQAEQYDVALPGGGQTGNDTLRFWYLPGDPAAPTVLYLHGARHNLYGNVHRIERLNELGFNVLALDYRGFGRSTRILPSEHTAIEDARLAFAELQRRQPIESQRLLYGYSLGGAVAIALAQEVDGMAGVVVESTFTSIADLVRTMRWGWVPFVNIAVTQNFNSLQRIASVNEPLLFLHGTADGIVPHTMSDRLYAAARAVPDGQEAPGEDRRGVASRRHVAGPGHLWSGARRVHRAGGQHRPRGGAGRRPRRQRGRRHALIRLAMRT
jgi:uncharacterized protein